MKRVYIKRLISLVMVLLVVFPVLVSASSPSSIIKKVYFKDETGNMVFVDYEDAINQSLEGDNSLYNGIKHYVGIAESKGKSIYLETNTGKKIDLKLAMIDNLFRLEDIMGKTKYEVNHEIVYSHELKIVGGVPAIVPAGVVTNYTINIAGPERLKLGETGSFNIRAYGDGKGNANYRARYEYRITGGSGRLEYRDGSNWREIPLSGNLGPADEFTLPPNWDLTTELRFTPAVEGTYSINLTLKDLDKNKTLTSANHTLTVTKIAVWPNEVENVVVGKSPITNITYANIEIKAAYLSIVRGVYVDNVLANKIEGKASQWRIDVGEGTTAEQLKGRVRVEVEGTGNPDARVIVEVRNSSDLIPALIQLKVNVANIANAAKYDVVYQLSGGGGSNTAKFDLGTWTTESIFFNPRTITDKITIRIYDATGESLLYTFADVVIQNPLLP